MYRDGSLGLKQPAERGDMSRTWASQYRHYQESFSTVNIWASGDETKYYPLRMRSYFLNNSAASGGAVAVSAGGYTAEGSKKSMVGATL